MLFSVAVAATALWYTARPAAGLGNAGQLGGEALFLFGIVRITGRPVPWWMFIGSVGFIVVVNTHYWLFDGNSDFLMGVYSTVAGLLPLQAIWLLLKRPQDSVTRPAQLLVGISLVVYSSVTLVRGYFGFHDWWLDKPYTPPHESFSRWRQSVVSILWNCGMSLNARRLKPGWSSWLPRTISRGCLTAVLLMILPRVRSVAASVTNDLFPWR